MRSGRALHRFLPVLIASLLLGIAVPLFAAHVSLPSSVPRHRHGHFRHFRTRRWIHWNPLLKGSHESLLRQNEEIDRLDLPRIEDDAQLQQLEESGDLVPIPDSDALQVSPRVEPDRRYCRPWVLTFLQDLSQAYFDRFHRPLQITSAVRTMNQQRRLRRHNPNAAPDWGDTASSHLAGVSIDLSRKGLTRAQHKWLEDYVANLRDLGLVEAAEERRQACFHLMVLQRYADWHETSANAGRNAGN